MTGIQSASCSCEFNSRNQCICTIEGRAKVQYAGEYYVVLNWWSGNYVISEQIYHKVVRAGESATFNYSGTIDNTTANATGFSVFLLKYGDADFMSEQGYVTPEVCAKAPTEGVLRVRAKDANTGAYLYNASVYVDGRYYGKTLGAAYLIFAISPGFHAITLSLDGYGTEVVSTYVSAGVTVDESVSMDKKVTTGTVEVRAIVKDGTDEITGARIYQKYYGAVAIQDVDTGYTTPHTFTLDAGTHYFFTKREYFLTSPPQSVTLGAGDSKTATCNMVPAGLQCDIDLFTTGEGVTIPSAFTLPTPGITPTFGFKLPFNIGDFTYYGLGWAVLNEPAPHIVTSALVDSMVVKVNGVDVSPVISCNSTTGDLSFDILSIIKTLIANGSIAADLTQLKIDITYATRLWFETGNHSNNNVLYTETKTILIPITLPGFCSLMPSMNGPANIPVTLPALPSLPPVIGNSVLDINLGAACENLTIPSAVPIKLFLFGSTTPSISTSVSPTSYTPDISNHILPSITSMIRAGTPIPDTLTVLLQCPKTYAASGFSTTMTDTVIEIPLSAPPPQKTICNVGVTPVQPAGIVVSHPAIGLPGLNIATLPITGVMSIVCTANGASIPTPPGITPPGIDLYVMNRFVTTLSVNQAGNFTYDIINLIDAPTLIRQGITSIPVELQYPPTIAGGTTVKKSIPIPVTLPGTPDVPIPKCVLTNSDYLPCPDGTVIQINKCVNGVKMPIIPTPTCPQAPAECVLTNSDYLPCPDGTVIQINKCVNGVKVPTGAICPAPTPPTPITPPEPEPPVDTRSKTVYVTAPMVTRVGKRVSVAAFVRCGIEKSSGEAALVTVNGEVITTTNTKNGAVNASWIPVVAGLYTICVDVPTSNLCSKGSSSCTYIRVVSELSPPEIAAAEEEFDKAKKRIGEIMERI